MKNSKLFLLIFTMCLTTGCNKTNTEVEETPEEITYTRHIPSSWKPEENGRMFDENPLEQWYNYCSSIFVEDDGYAYCYYCRNVSSGNPSADRIWMRKGAKNKDDVWYWSEPMMMLDIRDVGWDKKGQCDPKVIKGEFHYNNAEYKYLMSYLGGAGDGDANYGCTFGYAVSKSPEGPWIRVDEISPRIPFSEIYINPTSSSQLWGIGQPSMISCDKKGKVLVFYTKHLGYQIETGTDWTTIVERWDFSNLNNAKMEWSYMLRGYGLERRTGGEDTITNADFMYDPNRSILYLVTDVHPFGIGYGLEGRDYPENIPLLGRLSYADLNFEGDILGDSIAKTNGVLHWIDIKQLSPLDDGFERHSNQGFYTDPYGWMLYKNKIEWSYTVSRTTEYNALSENWFTLRIHRYELDISKGLGK